MDTLSERIGNTKGSSLLRSVFFVLCILSFFVFILFLMGQPAWCVCGLKLMTLDAWGSESSQNFIDPYTSSHVLHGILFFAFLTYFFRRFSLEVKMFLSLLIEVGWEILENSPLIINRYRSVTASYGYEGDSILNSTSDVLFMLLGFWIAARLPWKWTLTFFVGVEVLMLFLYRDNLALNVLMLVYPLDVVRDWQMAH